MKVYVELSEDLRSALPEVQDPPHEMYDKQFDNVWVKPGMRVFEFVVEHLEDDQIAEHVEVKNDQGETLSPGEVAETLEQNNVIWQ